MLTPITLEAFDAPDVRIEGLTARQANNDDLEGLLQVEKLSQPAPWSEQIFYRELDLDYSRIWTLFDDKQVVGFLVFWVIVDEIHILNVCIAPSHRRRGLAATLISELVSTAQRHQSTIVSLEVRESNVAAQKLYFGLGFEPIGLRKRYYSDNGEDAVLLAKILEEDND